ncbi:MAG: Spy/CpxP family protein refolding chaperone [Syntrophobacteraceae bacterium]|nr:Spy/CpxP family protein refolding chaperone [Desulfobacteraceae bacterium]
MYRTKTKLMVVLAAVFLIGSSFAVAGAYGYGPGGKHGNIGQGHGPGGRHGHFGHDPFFRLVHKLKLTEDQKTQVAAIIKPQEEQIKAAVTALAKARVQLTKDILSGSGDIAADSASLAAAEQQIAQLRADIFKQVMTVLTPEQKAIVQKKVEKMGTHVDEMIGKRFSHLDKWLSKYGQ